MPGGDAQICTFEFGALPYTVAFACQQYVETRHLFSEAPRNLSVVIPPTLMVNPAYITRCVRTTVEQHQGYYDGHEED